MFSRKTAVNRRSFMTLAGGGAVALAAYRPSHASSAVGLKLSHPVGPTHPVFAASERIAKAMEERTGGEVTVTIFPNNALGAPPDTAQQTQNGAIDLVMMSPTNLASQAPESGVVQIPYQFDGYDHAHRTLGGTANKWIQDLLAANGLTWVANYEYGFRALTNSKRPILMPEDIQGLKLRVPPELSVKATFDALGANTQTISFSELYLALSSGTVDGQDNPVSVAHANKFYEVQDHIATTKHIYSALMLAANPRSLDKLTDEQRAILIEEATAAGQWVQEEVQRSEASMLEDMSKSGVEVTHPDPEPFRALMQPAHAVLRERIGGAAWDEWMGYVEAAR